MRYFSGFWLIWFLAIIFLGVIFVSYKIYELIFFLVLFAFIGINIYVYESRKKTFLKFKKTIKSVNLGSVEEEFKKIGKKQGECFTKISILETDLNQYKLDEERKYRDVVRKVLDLDNKVNNKFNLLGKSIIKISKEKNN